MTDTAHDAAGIPSEAPRTRRIMWGRIISLSGVLGLCTSFFSPHVAYTVCWASGRGTINDFAPVDIVKSGDLTSEAFILPFLAAVLLGPLLALRSLPQLDVPIRVGKALAWVHCTACLCLHICGLAMFIRGFRLPGMAWICPGDLGYMMLIFGLILLGLAMIALGRSTLPRKAAAAQFAMAAYFLTFFSFNPRVVGLYAGFWLSMTGSALLVIGAAVDWFQCRPATSSRLGH